LLHLLEAAAKHVAQLCHGAVFTALPTATLDGMAVARRIILPWRKTSVALACPVCSRGVDRIQVIQNSMDRFVEAVDIETMKRGPVILDRSVIMAAQPVGEFKDFDIAPHPCGEANEDIAFPRARSAMADIIVDPRGIGPVCLD